MAQKKLAPLGTNYNEKEFAEFFKKFYAHADKEELNTFSPEELEAKAQEAYKFIKSRKLGQPKLEIYNPSGQEKKPRTIVMVLNDNMPFLVDTITAELSKFGLRIHEIYHPIINVGRDKIGNFSGFAAGGVAESLVYLQITHVGAGEPTKSLKANLLAVLETVYAAVEDWKPMLAKVEETIASLKNAAKKYNKKEVEETEHFLKWLGANHFTFLGYVEYDFSKSGAAQVAEGSKLGAFRSGAEKNTKIVESEIEYFAKANELLEITKSDQKAMVHRNVYMDQIGVKKFDESGNVVGERWFTGLFASSAYFQTADTIPVIRGKVSYVLESSGLARGGHSAKIAQFVLDSYPRDEIFQSPPETLLKNTMAIIDLIKRPRVGFFTRRDRFDRFMTCLIYIPKEKMGTALRIKLQEILEKEVDAKISEYYTQISDAPLARLYLIVKPNNGKFPKFSEKELKQKITHAATSWADQLMGELFANFGEVEGDALFRKYENAFTSTYQAANNGENAVHDIKKIESLLTNKELEVEIYEQPSANGTKTKVKIFNKHSQIALSDIMPILENMGLRVLTERPYTIRPQGLESPVFASDFLVEIVGGKQVNLEQTKFIFEEALKKIIAGELENDSLNRLVLFSGLPWRDVALLRTYAKYMKQASMPFGRTYVRDSLVAQSTISALLVRLFYAQFDIKEKNKPAEIASQIEEELKKVSSLGEDKVLRWLNETIGATLRTNFFQRTNGQNKNYISIKLDAQKVPELPLPRPHVEVFVYSPDVEGIHLRGGKVARGGLRWSDRHEDFRTEVLGLIKAQMVKNAVIVPVGSKGGFVVKKKTSENRDEKLAAGIECYKTFLRGILDLTDNVIAGKIMPPAGVVRRDGDDPYLVVAADKGTATFSDIANAISAEYNFWLGDAFASGGSAGYDHKAMGITARGGWISVMRHFHEMGKNSQTEDFTCVGVGDMGGDVFGNGMLLSKHIKLVAAFNHMHIFLDPNPDSAASFKERERMFKLPRSSWEDYDKKLISKGGGIYLRSAKSIKISVEVQKALDIKSAELTPDELIKAILKAPVDLLWNGGIGTYVKAANETDRDVGDKNNDNLRINGRDLRCKVVGEGGNLGLTQRGRIEAARAGVRLNTDAIDNSAGVDCSDHEVNIKIALQAAMNAKKLTLPERNKLLAEMTDEVADLVLRDNYLQTQALTIAENAGVAALESQASLIRTLESAGKLNREIEYLPSEEELAKLAAEKKGLTRPEISVLLAYAKIALYDDILKSKVPDEDYFREDLLKYFPKQMQQKFGKFIENHQLRREIVATFIANSIVNRTGPTFFHSMLRDTDMAACDIARAYTVARDAFGLRDLWREIEALDGKVAYKFQVEMFVRVTKFIEHMTFWFLRNVPQPIDVAKAVATFSKYAREFKLKIPTMLAEGLAAHINAQEERLVQNNVPQKLAESIAFLDAMQSACDVAVVTNGGKTPLAMVGKIYFAVGSRLSLSWLRGLANNLQTENYWQRLAARNVVEGLYQQQRRLAGEITKSGKPLDVWMKTYAKEIARHEKMISELKMATNIDISMLVSAARRLENLGNI